MWRDSGGKLVGLTMLGLLVVVGVVWVSVAFWGGDRMPRDARVQGVDVGGLSRTAAASELKNTLARRARKPVRVTYGDGRRVDVAPADAGLSLDLEASLDRASGGARFSPSRIWALISGGGDHRAVVAVDRSVMVKAVERLTAGLDRPLREGAVEFRDGRAIAVYGRAGRAVDPDRAEALLVDGFLQGGRRKLPTVAQEPSVHDSAVDAAVRQIGEPAMSGPVTLVMGRKQLAVAPVVFGRGLSTEPDNGTLRLVVDGEAVVAALAPQVDTIASGPVDASFVIRNGKPRVKPSQPGRELDPAEVQRGLGAAVLGAGPEQRRLRVEGRLAQPELTTREARALGVRRRVSTFTTYYPYAEYRNINIGRAAELVDGTLLRPGETFSLNKIVGERTAANGFTQGYVISDGIFRTDYGGGVSQMATTTFNAMFFAGLKDVEHKPHSVYIDRYPEGREATVAWPSVDLRFQNDTPYAVLVKAKVTPGSPSSSGVVTVDMYSTKTWDITARKSNRYDYTSPSTRYLTAADCGAASGTSGFTVDVWRDFRRPGASRVVRTEKFNTVYIPGDRVVCGPRPGSGRGGGN